MGEYPIRLTASFVTALAIVLFGCRRAEDGGPPEPAPHPSRPKAVGQSPATRNGADRLADASRDTGTVEGTVRLAGEGVPTSTIVPVGADAQYCGHQYSKEDCVVDPGSRGIRYVIVHLAGKELDRLPKARPEHLLLDNKDCRFEPHAAVLTVGSTLEVRNSDKILHTAHAYFAATFNLALPQAGISLKRVLSRPGMVQIRCDNHGWMNAFIRVDGHPFHAVTDSQGRFKIVGVPLGTYTLEAWHERFGSQKREVSVRDQQTTKVNLTFVE